MSTQKLTVVCLLVLACSVGAQAPAPPNLPDGATMDRSVSATPNVTDFRPLGELRYWSFFSKKATFGHLKSTLTEGDDNSLVLEQELRIDYSKIGTSRQVYVDAQTRLAPDGTFLGSKMKLGETDDATRVELERDDDRVTGFYTRGGAEVPVDLSLSESTPVWDQDFVDQLEIFLARRDIKPGDSIKATLFSPQTMLTYDLSGYVLWFQHRQIHSQKWDSVFVIQFQQPQRYQAFLSPDKRLVRLDLMDQDIRIYQDLIQKKPGSSASKKDTAADLSPWNWRVILVHLPQYIAYLLMGVLVAVFLAQGGLKKLNAYLALVGGGMAYLPMLITQIPLQEWLITQIAVPSVTEGISLYLWGIWPALIAGVFQILALGGGIVLLVIWRNPREQRLPMIGAFFGAGFAIVEGVYILGGSIVPLFGLPLAERLFTITMMSSLGALVGCGLAGHKGGLKTMIPVAILIASLFRYAPVFVQQGAVQAGLMAILMGFAVLFLVVWTLLTLSSLPRSRRSSGEA